MFKPPLIRYECR